MQVQEAGQTLLGHGSWLHRSALVSSSPRENSTCLLSLRLCFAWVFSASLFSADLLLPQATAGPRLPSAQRILRYCHLTVAWRHCENALLWLSKNHRSIEYGAWKRPKIFSFNFFIQRGILFHISEKSSFNFCSCLDNLKMQNSGLHKAACFTVKQPECLEYCFNTHSLLTNS